MILEKPTFKYFPRNNITGDYTIEIENPNDPNMTEVWYTTDGSTPMDFTTHNLSPTAKKYTGAFKIYDTTKLKAQVTFKTGR